MRCGGARFADVVIEAISRAEFAPATPGREPRPSQVRVDLRVRQLASDGTAGAASSETVLDPGTAHVEKELVFSETAVVVDAPGQAPIKLELEGFATYGYVW